MRGTILGIFAAALLAPAAFAQSVVVDDDPSPNGIVVTSAVSRAFFLDTREGPRESDGTETLTFSDRWSQAGDSSVTILQNGDEVAFGLRDEGEWNWSVAAPGTYILEHATMRGGQAIAVETATFVVSRRLPDPEATLAWKYAKNANGWYCAQVAIKWRPEYADGISNMRLLFADRFEDDEETLAAYLVDPATVVDPLGETELYRDTEYRVAPIDLSSFASLKSGARAVFGVGDATLKSSLASVPKGERKICLRVVKRNLAALEDASAILAWESGGIPFFLPLRSVVAPPAPSIYTVRFSANGGTGKMSAQTMVSGEAAKLKAGAFTRKGWVFAGWATRKDGPVAYADGKAVKNLCAAGKSVTLYAVWAKPKYKVAFYANDGTNVSVAQTFKYGEAKALKANAFKRKGYAFQGWAKKKDGPVVFKNKKTVKNLTTTGGTVKLYAVWKKN